MVATSGAIAQASEYNTVATLVNKVFGDNYSDATPLSSTQLAAGAPYPNVTHKFGWGDDNLDDALSVSTSITAERLQELVDRTNVMVDHCNINDTILVFTVPDNTGRTTVDVNTPIRAEDLNVVSSKVSTTILPNNIHLTIDPYNASALIATAVSGGPYLRSTPWVDQLTSEHVWTFDSYNHARYFFNSGGQLRLLMDMTGGSTAGYYNWSDVINEIGLLSFNWDTLYQSNNNYTAGTTENKGFYDLTQYYGDGSDAGSADEGLLFTSAGVTMSSYGYGYNYEPTTALGYVSEANPPYTSATSHAGVWTSSAYSLSSYSNLRFKLYGKWADAGSKVVFKLVLDDSTFYQVIDGQLSADCSYLMPSIIERNTALLDVTPHPILSIIDNFNSGDDS
jgi:hypothetical protein